jgi:MFS family permease
VLRRDIYLVFLCKVFESYNYFSLSRILTLYLTEEFEINDYHAGIAFGLWGTLLVAYGLFLGGAIDALGVRSSLILCFVLNVASRLVMASTTTPWLLLAMLLGPNAAAGALGVPVMTIAVKRFTTPLNRGFAFSLFYTLMNLAALSQGVLMDVFRIRRGALPTFSRHKPGSCIRRRACGGARVLQVSLMLFAATVLQVEARLPHRLPGQPPHAQRWHQAVPALRWAGTHARLAARLKSGSACALGTQCFAHAPQAA